MRREKDLIDVLHRLTDHPTPITLADMSKSDAPLIFANRAFGRLTGYVTDFVIGKNCRILQGVGTDPDAVERLRQDIAARRQTFHCLLNYRQDGTEFHNLLMLAPIDLHANRDYVIGCQYEFFETVKDAELLDQIDAQCGALREVESFNNTRWDLLKRGVCARTESVRLKVDSYFARERARRARY